MSHRILLLGSGGREHALAIKLTQSRLCMALFVAPGNAGTAIMAQNVALDPLDFDAVAAFVRQQAISMVVVGPEDPLVAGIVDYFEVHPDLQNVFVVGPTRDAAALEGSKDFAKGFMTRHGIPTAGYRSFSNAQLVEAQQYIQSVPGPYVLKADGLAAGKGVVILNDAEEACAELAEMFSGKFGAAGQTVVIEQFLKGIEFSVFVLTDGLSYKILPVAKDYKRVGENDTGPNTGGMGSVSPPPFVTEAVMADVETRIVQPTIAGLQQEQLRYRGIIFIGLILDNDQPMVIEYNCRFGDPETQSVLPRLQNDLVLLFQSLFDGTLAQQRIMTDSRTAATVVVAAGGYPGTYAKDHLISGLDCVAPAQVVFAGAQLKNGFPHTAGGRVLGITALGPDVASASATALAGAAHINFDGAFYRNDIGRDLVGV